MVAKRADVFMPLIVFMIFGAFFGEKTKFLYIRWDQFNIECTSCILERNIYLLDIIHFQNSSSFTPKKEKFVLLAFVIMA